jgi:hypothetical protein
MQGASLTSCLRQGKGAGGRPDGTVSMSHQIRSMRTTRLKGSMGHGNDHAER